MTMIGDKPPLEEALAHYGVKGMKWGVRRGGPRGAVRRGATKAVAALDAGQKVINKGEEELIFLPFAKRRQAAGRTQLEVLGEARRVNKDPKFKGKDLKKNPDLKAEYQKAITTKAKQAYAKHLEVARTEAVLEFVEAAFSPRGDRMNIFADKSRVRHAETETLASFALELDEFDHIVNVTVVETEMAQGEDFEAELMHYGVKGMKWGIRRKPDTRSYQKKTADRRRRKQNIKSGLKVAAGVAVYAGAMIAADAKLNSRLQETKMASARTSSNTAAGKKMVDDLAFNNFKTKAKELSADIANANAEQDAWMRSIGLGAVVNNGRLRQSSLDAADDVLEHFGVKGMKWGVRKRENYEGATPAVNRAAKRDSKEFARAKMFYGEGAGTRRKLIKAKIEEKSKKDPTYKAAFDFHLAKQDLGAAASRAKVTRKAKDAKKVTGQAARAVNKAVNGPFGGSLTTTLTTAALRRATGG